MHALQHYDLWARDTHAIDQLQDLLRQRRATYEPVEALATYAQELPRRFVAAEREAFGQELAHCAVPAEDPNLHP